MSNSIWEHFPLGCSPGTPPALLSAGPMFSEASRLKQEVEEAHRVLKHWDHSWRQMSQVGFVSFVNFFVCVKHLSEQVVSVGRAYDDTSSSHDSYSQSANTCVL